MHSNLSMNEGRRGCRGAHPRFQRGQSHSRPPVQRTVILRGNAIRTVAMLVLAGASTLAGQSNPKQHFHSLIPLGADAYEIHNKQWKGNMTLMASAESPDFEGMELRSAGRGNQLFSENGKKIDRFPARVDFRVTATFRAHFAETSPFPIGARMDDQNGYLLGLKFRVVVFHGLRQTIVQARSVEMIGVPGEMPYDERIYRISVNLAEFPLTDRVVLEVHDPDGGRIAKFHLDLL